MTLTIELTPDEEARISARADAQGVPVDVYVSSVLKEVATGDTRPVDKQTTSRLPIWPGKVIGELRRVDIYDDVR